MITQLLRRLGAHIKIKFIVVTLLLHYNIIDVLFVNTFFVAFKFKQICVCLKDRPRTKCPQNPTNHPRYEPG